ncbi:MAG: hypothetical protein JHC98_07360 [Thermoleophilaceae bacterium]|nr:hypothetical protein [Thermoleophilaceae bacterium]
MLLTKYTSARAGLAAVFAVFALAALTVGSSIANADGMTGATHAAAKNMKVSIKVKPDKMAGYNLFVTTRGFRWAPEHASGKHVKGEGHAHLLIDGVKVTRLYGNAYYMGKLASGTHQVTVELNGNDHIPYARKGHEIASNATVVVP